MVAAAATSSSTGGIFRRLRFAATGAILAFTGVGTSTFTSFPASPSSSSTAAAASSFIGGGNTPLSTSATRGGGSSRRGITTETSAFLGFGKKGDASTTTPTTTADGEMGGATVLDLAQRADNSWLKQLTADPESARHAPNRSSRQVKSGHYVRVAPVPLSSPKLVIHSPAMAADLGIAEEVRIGGDPGNGGEVVGGYTTRDENHLP